MKESIWFHRLWRNNAEVFLKAVQELEQLGYQEVNLNLGCPSRTVVTKYRGAGFLAKPDALEQFLEEVYGRINIRLSLKQGLGWKMRMNSNICWRYTTNSQ